MEREREGQEKMDRKKETEKESEQEGVRMREIEERGGIEDEGTRKRSHKANRVLNDCPLPYASAAPWRLTNWSSFIYREIAGRNRISAKF